MKTQARVAIIGGGVMGCSLAYHLAEEGWSDLVLLEKGELTSGSTWHAAGQITHSVSHFGLAKMAAYGTELYPRLEAETGQSATWHGCGSLRVAYLPEEVDWLHHTRAIGRGLGHEMEIVGPERIAELHPFYNTEGILAALHTPHDGHVDPAGVTFALAAGARARGAEIRRHCRATGLRREGAGWIVETEQGEIRAGIVVNAAGTYARQVGAWAGLDLPIANLLHHYLITEPVPEFADLATELPVIRDDRLVSGYVRMEQKSGLIGIYEKANAATVWDDGTPWEAEHELFDPDYDRIMPWLENAMERMPVLAELGIRRVVHGAITHPPDGNMMLGPSGVENLWLCCGSQVGIAWGPGAGRYLAQWMVHGAADISMASFDPRRFGARIDETYRIGKAKEDYLLRHEIPFPQRDRPGCRPSHSKTSPLYAATKAKGAVFQDVYGWERPYWYAPEGMAREHIHSFRRSALHDVVGAEVDGLRTRAGIADLTAFAKIEAHGADLWDYLGRISSNRLPRNTGSVTLTYLVNPNGRLEGEATLVKLAGDRAYIVYAAAREAALLDWMRGQRRPGERVAFDNVSEARGVIMLAGPLSREILAACTGADLSNAGFRWLSTRAIEAAGVADIRAMRVTYTGELGWELHVPMAGMAAVHAALVAAGEPRGMVHVGAAALNAMRMEKAYRSGHEITAEVTLAEAGLARFSRAEGFQGAAASLAPATRWKLALLRLEEPEGGAEADPLGSEAVWHAGEAVGAISSGGYGYGIGAWLGWAYLRPALAEPGTRLEVMVLGRPRAAEVVEGALRDPENARPRADRTPAAA
ncbi:FAD-dependent oxidoreductase [Paralimibaculum aggregatum]|uniref:FAD-dependent oxidoreductase n=1 Tax=Paralimibaculum aggregatum TaxID=3036245 RepID=A0ABQ6LFB0_9RHOB|nr:FAD-dependent oxidoreductase [Limibaculum sp. NKW23]GMG82021.1 FAD-dependent oxidoreductase [Limibaculum sp. NKW23]